MVRSFHNQSHMNNTFVIAWRSKAEPRMGQGKKRMTREEAESLSVQLNQDYPGFVHHPVDLDPQAQANGIVEVDFRSANEEPEREAVLI